MTLSLVAVSTELCGEVSSIKNSGGGTSFDAIVLLVSHYTHLLHTLLSVVVVYRLSKHPHRIVCAFKAR